MAHNQSFDNKVIEKKVDETLLSVPFLHEGHSQPPLSTTVSVPLEIMNNNDKVSDDRDSVTMTMTMIRIVMKMMTMRLPITTLLFHSLYMKPDQTFVKAELPIW